MVAGLLASCVILLIGRALSLIPLCKQSPPLPCRTRDAIAVTMSRSSSGSRTDLWQICCTLQMGIEQWGRSISRCSAEAVSPASMTSNLSPSPAMARQRTRKADEDKGHRRELELTVEAMRHSKDAPIPFAELIEVTEATFAVEEAIRTQRTVPCSSQFFRFSTRMTMSAAKCGARRPFESEGQRRTEKRVAFPANKYSMGFSETSKQQYWTAKRCAPLYWVLVLLSLVPLCVVLPMAPTKVGVAIIGAWIALLWIAISFAARGISLRRSCLGGRLPLLLLSPFISGGAFDLHR